MKKKSKGLKGYLAERKNRLSQRMNLVDNKKVNRGLNWGILIIETLFIIYALNAVYGCPCAYRTCSIKHYMPGSDALEWEANNLDCGYTQDYLEREAQIVSGGQDMTIDQLTDYNFSLIPMAGDVYNTNQMMDYGDFK